MKAKKPDSTKIIVNLTRKSQNWTTTASDITKKQTFYQKKLGPNHPKMVALKETKNKKEEPKKPEIWFDVDKIHLPEADNNVNEVSDESAQNGVSATPKPTVISAKITKTVGIDCEMVGVGETGKDSILARVSLVNQYGEAIYDKYVLPTEKVTDYRTRVSGIRPEDLKKSNKAVEFSVVQKEVADIIEGKILVGHAIHNDMQVLYLSHPKKKIRDTQKCKVFRQILPSLGGLSSLKTLAKSLLGIDIQEGEHNSVHDAQAAMRLYTTYKKEWETYLRNQKLNKKEPAAPVQNLAKAMAMSAGHNEIENRDIKGSDNHKRYIKNKLKKRINRKFVK
jgi:RNA exonuclease 4